MMKYNKTAKNYVNGIIKCVIVTLQSIILYDLYVSGSGNRNKHASIVILIEIK